MKLDTRAVGTLFRNEIRMLLRDRRTVITSIVLPLLVMPLMLFASSIMNRREQQKLEQTVFSYAVVGSQAATVRALIDETKTRGETAGGQRPGKLQLKEADKDDPAEALARGDLHFYIEALSAAEAREATAKRASEAKAGKEKGEDREIQENAEESGEGFRPDTPIDGAPVVVLVFRADREDSRAGVNKLREALLETRRGQRAALLKARGFPAPAAEVAAVSETNLASEGQVAGLALGKLITVLLLLFILSGGAVVATDSLAGEKERGTLETLLTTAVGRGEIIAAKHLAVIAVAVTITLIQAANFLVYVGFKVIPASTSFTAAVTPPVALLLFVLYLPLAALAASALIYISGRARSYKEAQLLFFPVFLIGLVPALAPLLPGLPLRSAIVLVPIANIAVAVKEILIGSFDWPMIVLSWLATAAAAAFVTHLGVRSLSTEKLITAADTDAIEYAGGPKLFPRHVLRWFVALFAVLLVVSNYSGSLDIRWQLVINLMVLFLGASLLMIRRYHLEPRAAFALRAPKPVVWLAVAVGAPATLLSGLAVFRLANVFVPVPPKVLDGFSQMLAPSELGIWQIVLFLCVMPGFFEELTFRGVLLHGLSRRMHPVAVAVVVGLVFGVFHVSVFRLAPTAFLGVVFAAVTLMTGSIYPAMVWHAVNNGIALLAARAGADLYTLPAGLFLAAVLLMAAAFWLIWRNRTPYPGLRPWRRPRSPR
jgi:sodium transport system permease protein